MTLCHFDMTKEIDWSLKGKGSWGILMPSTSFSGPSSKWIPDKDIRTLRQKLIEDFIEVNDWLILKTDTLDITRVKKIINKRFGVKDESNEDGKED